MFVHVGKTGGSSLSALFRAKCSWLSIPQARNECFAMHRGPGVTESTLSLKTKSVLHVKPRRDYKRWINATTTFLFFLRSPVSRTVSAFDYGHPMNSAGGQAIRIRKFYECFPTAEHLAQSFAIASNSNNISNDCLFWGQDTLKGTGKGAIQGHLSYNTGRYLDDTILAYPDKEIMAVRTQHLWSDLSNLDVLLGGSGNFSHVDMHVDHGSAKYEVKSELTQEGRQLLCKALKNEVVTYKYLIWSAKNLQDWEKKDTMDYLKQDCGGIDTFIDGEIDLTSH